MDLSLFYENLPINESPLWHDFTKKVKKMTKKSYYFLDLQREMFLLFGDFRKFF